MAESEYVVLFNNDAFAEPQWLAELIRTAETDPKIFAVQSLMIRHFDRELADDAGDYVTWMGFACKTAAVSAATPNKSVSSRPAAGPRCTASAFWTRSAPLTKTFLPTLRMWT